ncbi:hypothetical protein T03_12451 [Trichinella britovi]|uniref:Uncharacterized protein n=1 Tax=Trichinella britovi TaxID=45882 RepID=A0A0V0YVK1_TRIBR|nr:hypothetical protein T03_12451 [Trichinella britovi]
MPCRCTILFEWKEWQTGWREWQAGIQFCWDGGNGGRIYNPL